VPLRLRFGGIVIIGLCAGAASLRADRLDCPPAQQPDPSDDEIRAALPGSDEYLPFPFPASDAERIADLTYQIERMEANRALAWHRESQLHHWARVARLSAADFGWHLAARVGAPVGLHLLRGVAHYSAPLRDGSVRISFETVQDWTHMRCVYVRGSWSVARVFDVATGTELSRISLSQAGFNGSSRDATPDFAFPPWPDARAAMARLGAVAGKALAPPVLLRTDVRCSEVMPCVAAETTDGSAVYIADPGGAVFRASLVDRLLIESRELATPEQYRAAAHRLAEGEFFLKLGPDVLGVGEPLAPAPP
jgi:hypothetical protein